MSGPGEQRLVDLATSEAEELVLQLVDERQRLSNYANEVAHDLRSPVRRMRIFAELAQQRLRADTVDLDEVRHFTDRAIACAEMLDERVCALLESASARPGAESSEPVGQIDRRGPVEE